MTARPDSFRVHVGDQVLAALAEAAPRPLSTPDIAIRTGYGLRSGHGQLISRVLAGLLAAGEVEKLGTGTRPVYWRRTRPQVALPPMTVCTDRDDGMAG
jgi:hypothetical protein